MKKNKLIILLIAVVLVLSGCTKRFTIEEGKGEEKNTTSYVANILCKPTTNELIDIYKNNEKKAEVKYDKLPECKNFKVNSGGYEGLWTSVFVKPLAWIVIKLGIFFKNYGVAIIVAGLALRAILYPFSKKSTMMSENMKKAQPELNRLEKKYEGKTDQNLTMMKSQEMMAIYKKYDISPLSGCLFAFLQLPIFFAFLEAVYRIPVLFEGKFLMYNLGETPVGGISAENYWYLLIIVLIVGTTYLSFKNMNTAGTDDAQAKQMQMMSKFMIIFIAIASLRLPVAVALYWIASSTFTIVQNYILKKKSNSKEEKPKLKSLKAKTVKVKKVNK